MKRTRSEHGINSEDMSSKRIVRRKVTSGSRRQQSPSTNQDLEPQRREVRTTSSILKYVKYSGSGADVGGGGGGSSENYSSGSKYHSKYGSEPESVQGKFDHFERRSNKGRSNLEGGSIRRNPGLSRHVSSRDNSGHSNHHIGSGGGGGGGGVRYNSYDNRFDFSLRIGSLDVDMHDGELKTCLFDNFKHYGFIQIKVLGRGRERHAFINFTQKDDAQRALSEMSEFYLQDVPLKTEWSKSTLNRYPEVANSAFETRSRREGLSTRPSTSARSRHHGGHYDNYTTGGGGRDSIPPASREKSYSRREVSSRSSHEVSRDIPREVTRDLPRDIPRHISRDVGRDLPREGGDIPREPRDISYKLSRSNSGSLPSPSRGRRHSSSGPSTSSRHEPRAVVPITDPNATRTLFVGNLEQDITERELRDLFGPYGRIESVDIKTQRISGSTYAFVKFLTINDAINAKNDMHGRKYGEYRLKIGFGRGAPTGKVWIGNLTCLADLKEVQQELDRFGLIRKLDYQDGDDHAFIQLDSLDAAQAAIVSLAGYRIRNTGRTLKIDFCKPIHLRDDPDFHLRRDHSHSLDDSYSSSPSFFKRKVRDHDYSHGSGGGADVSVRRVKDPLDDVRSLKGERIVSSSVSSKSRRDETRHEYRKRAHSPVGDRDGKYSNRLRSDELNGGSEYHSSKRPRIVSENSRRSERESDRERNRTGRDRERDSKRTNGDKDKKEPTEKKKEKVEKNNDTAKDTKKEEKTEKSGDQPHPVLETTLSDIAAKDTALKLDHVPEQLAMESGAGDPSPLVPETLNDLAILYPVAWRGNLVLKNTGFPTRMHLVGGDPAVAETLLRSRDGRDYLLSLRITQRLRLEQPRLEEVNKRMVSAGPGGFCVLLALPGPVPSASLSPETDVTMQLRPLRSLVSYLKQKEAAGIVALSGPEGSETASASFDKDVVGVLHAFPPCEFSQSHLVKIAPRLGSEPAKEDHIVVLLVKGNV